MSDIHWLDFLEGETDPELRLQMKAILRKSKKSQETLASLEKTKAMLVEHQIETPAISDDFLEGLESRIMAKVEQTSLQPKSSFIKLRTLKKIVKGQWKAGASLLAVLLVVATYSEGLLNKSPNAKWDVAHSMVDQIQNNSGRISGIMNYQRDDDFYMDIAAQNLDHLTKEQLEEEMEQLVR